MIDITIASKENLWDEENEVFIRLPDITITLEHSLISISKWEAKWHKPFLLKNEKTPEEIFDYIQCMMIKGCDIKDYTYMLSEKNMDDITNYINDTMTATVIPKRSGKGGQPNNEILTSERIYYYMTFFNIPVEFEKWHLSRLLTLIQVCDSKQEQKEPMTPGEIASRNAALNAKRRSQHGSMG